MTELLKKLKSGKLKQPDFIPMSKHELNSLGWDAMDILLVTGDAYIDHPSFGITVIGRILISAGYKVGIIAQPDWKNPGSLKVLGTPKLACAITSGNLDSMLNIYTAGRRIRKNDAYSPGDKAGLRPAGAVNVYTNLAKASFPGIPVIIGGIEASMRRIAHYDYWKDKIQPSVLLTSKADILVYGMGEKAVLNIAERLASGTNLSGIPGTSRFPGKTESEEFLETLSDNYIELPSHNDILNSKDKLMLSQKLVEGESNPFSGRGLFQRHGDRLVIVEKSELPLTSEEFDTVYELPFSYKPHPSYKEKIPAFEMIQHSITAVRGCPGGCSFCGLGLHQGKFLTSRSPESVIKTVDMMSSDKGFKGTISDVGGPTANTYGCRQNNSDACGRCKRPSCLFPSVCGNFHISTHDYSALLDKIRKMNKVKHVFVSSGLRLDIWQKQKELFEQIVRYHTSGHLKVAPEHLDDNILKLMRKNKSRDFYEFTEWFHKTTKTCGREQYIVPYFISNFPGSTSESMRTVEVFLKKNNWSLQQVQDFMPLPMTMAAAMYYAECDPEGNRICVNKGLGERRPQLDILKKKRYR